MYDRGRHYRLEKVPMKNVVDSIPHYRAFAIYLSEVVLFLNLMHFE